MQVVHSAHINQTQKLFEKLEVRAIILPDIFPIKGPFPTGKQIKISKFTKKYPSTPILKICTSTYMYMYYGYTCTYSFNLTFEFDYHFNFAD